MPDHVRRCLDRMPAAPAPSIFGPVHCGAAVQARDHRLLLNGAGGGSPTATSRFCPAPPSVAAWESAW
eukprot:scaffold380028_cov17-Prasinocladus_malaysianus.AAC.1